MVPEGGDRIDRAIDLLRRVVDVRREANVAATSGALHPGFRESSLGRLGIRHLETDNRRSRRLQPQTRSQPGREVEDTGEHAVALPLD